jgi:hypothetical protein
MKHHRSVQAMPCQVGDALAGPGFAHDTERPAPIEGEAQAIDRLHQPVAGREVHAKINYL